MQLLLEGCAKLAREELLKVWHMQLTLVTRDFV